MKLLLLSVEFPPGPGGLGSLAYQVASQLARLGWQIVVATKQSFASRQEIESFNRSLSFELHRFTFTGPAILEGADRLLKAAKLIRRERPDAILAIGRQAVWVGAAAGALTGIPVIAAGAGTEFTWANPLERALSKWSFGRAGKVICISRYTKGLALAFGIAESRIAVILPAADAHRFDSGLETAKLRENLGLKNSKVILTVGQVSERKAQDVLIQALPQIKEVVPESVYLIVGLPSKRERMERLADALGVSECIKFTGVVSREELPLYYNLADVFVLVSRSVAGGEVEGFGISVLEAALCGKPAVVSGETGLEEAVIPGETGLVVPQSDPEATARAVVQLLLDDELRANLGIQAREHALQSATWELRGLEYEAVVKTILPDVQEIPAL